MKGHKKLRKSHDCNQNMTDSQGVVSTEYYTQFGLY